VIVMIVLLKDAECARSLRHVLLDLLAHSARRVGGLVRGLLRHRLLSFGYFVTPLDKATVRPFFGPLRFAHWCACAGRGPQALAVADAAVAAEVHQRLMLIVTSRAQIALRR
jgi:hypothetical protein